MKRGLTTVLSAFLLIFYVVIILYVLFEIIHIDALSNFMAGMIFEVIGFLILAFIVLGNIYSKSVKTGFFVPLVVATGIYTVILDVINIVFAAMLGRAFFFLIHLLLLFVYCLVSFPMYIMGKR